MATTMSVRSLNANINTKQITYYNHPKALGITFGEIVAA
jgi:hypothetical protein